MLSPYLNQPHENWLNITQKLIEQYPLSMDEILDISLISWSKLWSSVIGDEIPINEVELPSTVVGYFFQKLFAFELSRRYPYEWRGENQKGDKDLVNINNPIFSTEMKTSGQLGLSLYGNRSYNQVLKNGAISSKDKSGYYITLNFYKTNITSLRFGWIDQDDWIPQSSQTGQAAILKPEVYSYKLVEIKGKYIQNRPIGLLNQVGDKSIDILNNNNIYIVDDLKNYHGNDPFILRIKKANSSFLDY